MSGLLVGEVLAAADSLRKRGLSDRGFHALVAIAERCRTETRQASVPWSHISAGLFGASLSTCKRAVADLKAAAAVRVVKRGFDNQNGRVCAPIYELCSLGDQFTQVTRSGGDEQVSQVTRSGGSERTSQMTHSVETEQSTQVTHSPVTERVISGGRTGQNDDRTGHPGDTHTGSITGSLTGVRARPECPDHEADADTDCRHCMRRRRWDLKYGAQIEADEVDRKRQERAAAAAERKRLIKACPHCDEFGDITFDDSVKKCTHPREVTHA